MSTGQNPCSYAVAEALDQPKVVITSVFAITHMIRICIWIHHHTAIVIFADVGFGKSADKSNIAARQNPCPYAATEASDQQKHKRVATSLSVT